jgi:hypothetical protein
MSKPLIQIDNIGTAREMTDEEYANYLEMMSDAPALTEPTDETPSPD